MEIPKRPRLEQRMHTATGAQRRMPVRWRELQAAVCCTDDKYSPLYDLRAGASEKKHGDTTA